MALDLTQLREIISTSFGRYDYYADKFNSFDVVTDYKNINTNLNVLQKHLKKRGLDFDIPVDVSTNETYYIKEKNIYIIVFEKYFIIVKIKNIDNEMDLQIIKKCSKKNKLYLESFYQSNDENGKDIILPNIFLRKSKKDDYFELRVYHFSNDRLHNKFGPAKLWYYTDTNNVSQEEYYLDGARYTKLNWLKQINADQELILKHLKETQNTLIVGSPKVKLNQDVNNLDEIAVELMCKNKLIVTYAGENYSLEALSNCGKFMKLKKVSESDDREEDGEENYDDDSI